MFFDGMIVLFDIAAFFSVQDFQEVSWAAGEPWRWIS